MAQLVSDEVAELIANVEQLAEQTINAASKRIVLGIAANLRTIRTHVLDLEEDVRKTRRQNKKLSAQKRAYQKWSGRAERLLPAPPDSEFQE
jgi:hypothetical protein